MAKRKTKKTIGALPQSEINTISVRIFNQARKGTPFNPGVPVALANLMVAQARHETGSFTSNAFTKHKNAFGYSYYPGSNYQTGNRGLVADNGQPVADYATVEDSVKELVDWIYRRRRAGVFPDLATITQPQQYAELLKRASYYQDTLTNYLTGLTNFLKQIVPEAGGRTVVVLVAVGYAAYIWRRDLFGSFM